MTDIDGLLDTHDAMALAELVARRDVTAVELVDAVIARVEARNPVLNAVIAERYDAARAEATTLTTTGPVAGVPFLVKDLNCDVAGLPATRGSRLFADVVATADAELTRRYRSAGLLILGNTNTPEFGKNASTEPLLHGPTHNPWELDHSTGGSSGGSAASVAAGIVPAAHANDGGGSIRIPASECGLFGLKPSRGRTPIAPTPGAFAYPVGIGHAVTRTVRDSAALLDVVSGGLPGDPYPAPPGPAAGSFLASLDVDPGRLRIGYSTTSVLGRPIHPAAVEAIERTARTLESLGHEVSEGMPTWDPGMVTNVLSTVMGVATAKAVEDRLAELGRPLGSDDLDPFDMFLHERSLATTAIELHVALQQLELVSRDLSPFFTAHDLWLTATIPVPVPRLGVLDTSNIEAMFTNAGRFSELTAVFNVSGQPAASVPAGFDADGLPVGVQLVAAHAREDLLLQVASQLETAAPWPLTAPWPPR